MASTINASSAYGLVSTADTSGTLALQANGSTVATLTSAGFTYVTPPTAAPTFSAYMSNSASNLSLPSNTYTKVKIDTKNWDTNSNFDNTTNYRFTPTVAGYYQINGGVFINYSSTAPHNCAAVIYKNGSIYRQGYILTNAGDGYGVFVVSSVIYFNGTTDYVELYAFQYNSGNAYIVTASGAPYANWFDGAMIRSA